MPEGDTIHRIATALAPRLVGQTLDRVTTQGLERAVGGQTVTSVASHGKHLVIELDDGTQLRVHMGMYGRQRSYDRARGDAILASMSPGRASLAITTRDAVHLWIGARTVEIASRRAPRRGMAVRELGPDLLAPGFDPAAAAARAAAHPDRTISEVLLDQRIAAGIGNIWRCESLFACGIDPKRRTGTLDLTTLATLYATARDLMQARAPHAVYSRGGQPCQRCRRPIEAFRMGDPPRWVWWCPSCQCATSAHGGVRGDRS